MIPVHGMASYNHISNPGAHKISQEQLNRIHNENYAPQIANDVNEKISQRDHDSALAKLSAELERQEYCRMEMECLACESMVGQYLRKKDCFQQGGTVYDLDPNGNVVYKKYGWHSNWVVREY